MASRAFCMLRSTVCFLLFCCQPGIDQRAFWRWLVSIPDFFKYCMSMSTLLVQASFICFFYTLYWFDPPFIKRVSAHLPWPWHHPNVKIRETEAKHRRAALMWWAQYNTGNLLFIWFVGTNETVDGRVVGARIDEQLPSRLMIAAQVFLMLLLDEFFHYWTHRLSHIFPFLYRFHKPHHISLHVTVLSAAYFSLFEIFLEVVNASLAAIVTIHTIDLHLYSLLLFSILSVVAGYVEHSGYDFDIWIMPPPFSVGPWCEVHDLHHQLGNVNFGRVAMDKLFGTYMDASDRNTLKLKVRLTFFVLFVLIYFDWDADSTA